MSVEMEGSSVLTAPDERLQYRALSTAAVVSVVLGVASVISLFAATSTIEACLFTLPVPLAGIVFGIRAATTIRRNPQEYTGLPLALSGIMLSAALGTGGMGLAVYTYLTEVPDGYQRVTFSQMKPEAHEKNRGEFIPPEVQALQGKQIFLKGYMRPSSQMFGLDSFLLVRDNDECCFGKNLPDYFDQVQVHLQPPLQADYGKSRLYRVGGTLHIDPRSAQPGSRAAVFTLAADYIK